MEEENFDFEDMDTISDVSDMESIDEGFMMGFLNSGDRFPDDEEDEVI